MKIYIGPKGGHRAPAPPKFCLMAQIGLSGGFIRLGYFNAYWDRRDFLLFTERKSQQRKARRLGKYVVGFVRN